MPTRQLGRTGILLKPVAYGAMHLSIDADKRPSEAESVRLLQRIVDELGIDFIDTADAYCINDTETGHNERLIAKALDGERRARVTVATKGGSVRPGGRWERDGRPVHLRSACEASLRALGGERIDLYQLHVPDPNVSIEESVGAMAQMQTEGKIEHIGISNVTLDQLRRAMSEATIVSVQNQFSVINQREDAALLTFCEEHGISYLPWNPVGGRGKAPTLDAQMETLANVAERHGVSAHEVALAWLLALSPAMLPIPGARTFEHVEANVRAGELVLTAEELEELSAG